MPSTTSTRRSSGSPARTCRCPMPPISRAWRCRGSRTSSRAPKQSAARRRKPRTGGAMPIESRMPALSPTMTEGNLARWLKQEGDRISAGEVIAEIETDKATMEIEAVEEGKLGRILIADGTEGVAVNTPIALLLEDDEDASALANFPSDGGGETAAPIEAEVVPPVAAASSARPTTK